MPCYIVKEKEAKKLGHVEILGRVNEKVHLSQAIKSPASQNMTAGYIRLDPGYHREIQSPVDEVDLFLEGSLTFTAEGTTFTAQKGDIVFIKKRNSGNLRHRRRLPCFLCNLSAVSGDD